METKANYVAVGVFTLLLLAAAFIFVYWTAKPDRYGETAPLQIQIAGSAAGLDRGSAVLFNGVKVGQVTRVFINPANPAIAVAEAVVDSRTPVTSSTTADIVIAGLSFAANIDLKRPPAVRPGWPGPWPPPRVQSLSACGQASPAWRRQRRTSSRRPNSPDDRTCKALRLPVHGPRKSAAQDGRDRSAACGWPRMPRRPAC